MVVNINGKNHCRTWWWITCITYTKLVFLISLHQTVFENFKLFFIQSISCTRLGNVQNTAKSLPLLRIAEIRDNGVVTVSQKYQTLSQLRMLECESNTIITKCQYPWSFRSQINQSQYHDIDSDYILKIRNTNDL